MWGQQFLSDAGQTVLTAYQNGHPAKPIVLGQIKTPQSQQTRRWQSQFHTLMLSQQTPYTSLTIDSQGHYHCQAEQNTQIEVNGNYHCHLTQKNDRCDTAGKRQIQAKQSIVFTHQASYIALKPDEIILSGKRINFN